MKPLPGRRLCTDEDPLAATRVLDVHFWPFFLLVERSSEGLVRAVGAGPVVEEGDKGVVGRGLEAVGWEGRGDGEGVGAQGMKGGWEGGEVCNGDESEELGCWEVF